MGVFLGFEGGATKTQVVLVEGGELKDQRIYGPSNLTNTPSEVLQTLFTQATQDLGINPKETSILAGFAGAGVDSLRQNTQDLFTTIGFAPSKISIMTDAHLALETVGQEGLVIIAGTGSVCLGKNGNRTARSGGNGFLLDEKISAYYLGRKLLRDVLNANGGTARPTIMGDQVLRFFNQRQVRDSIPIIYSPTGKDLIPNLAKIVFDFAAKGDPIAQQIITESVDGMAANVRRVFSELQISKNFTLALRGGVFNDPLIEELILSPLRRKLESNVGGFEILMLERPEEPNFTLVSAIKKFSHSQEKVKFTEIKVRATEAISTESLNLDLKDTPELLNLISNANFRCFTALREPSFLAELNRVYQHLSATPEAQLILAGAGTSGRLGLILSHFYKNLSGLKVTAWLAGGEEALKVASEGSEDDSLIAYQEIYQAIDKNLSNILILGISCGLSAPCVSGALLAARDFAELPASIHDSKKVGLSIMGMLPLASARREPAPGSSLSFAAVLEDLMHHHEQEFYPLVIQTGAEILQGSTRLNGGTATFLALNSLLTAYENKINPAEVLLAELKRLEERTFAPELAKIIDAGRQAIKQGQRIFLIGSNPELLAACDQEVAEIPPTFGVAPERVCVIDLNSQGDQLSLIHPADLVIEVGVSQPQSSNSLGSRFQINPKNFIDAKLDLNAITTAIFVQAGFVIGNEMLNLQINNSKLFDRAVGIISRWANVSTEAASKSLIASLLNEQNPTAEDLSRSKSELVSYTKDGVVPLGILHAKGIPLAEGQKLRESANSWREVLSLANIN